MSNYKVIECDKMHYRKYKTKIKFHTALNDDIYLYRNSGELDKLLGKLEKKLATKNKSGKYKVTLRGVWYRTPSPSAVSLTRDQLETVVDAIRLIHTEDKNIVSMGYYSKYVTVFTNKTQEWESVLQKAGDPENAIWKISERAEKLFDQNENICIVKTPPEYEFKIYLSNRNCKPELARFLKSNPDGFRVGPITMENIKNNYYCNGNYFYAKNRKYFMLLQMSYPECVRRVDRMVYKYAETEKTEQ